ncbi:hypothetical protein PCE1_003748 [Barthelona sp. PCE]
MSRYTVDAVVKSYGQKYHDETYEYRHVILTPEATRRLPKPARLLTEAEWRSLGVRQSPGWEHYMNHSPEPHILMFRRRLQK